jgi:DNA glycosylase AlkZ-like
MLLDRARVPLLRAIEQMIALQAQLPRPPVHRSLVAGGGLVPRRRHERADATRNRARYRHARHPPSDDRSGLPALPSDASTGLDRAPRPDADAPAPVRFLPEYDNLIIARSDERVLAREHRSSVFLPGLRVLPIILADGLAVGTWKVERKKDDATLAVGTFKPLPRRVRQELEEEGAALVRFVEPDATRAQITFT